MIDIRKASHELERMIRGEITYDPDYLSELIETDEDIKVEFTLTCYDCGTNAVVIVCPECKIFYRKDCPLCDGKRVLFDCPKCSAI